MMRAALGLLAALTCAGDAAERVLDPALRRIVALGDSITDGGTYPARVIEALKAAGYPAPVIINAGIGGDTVPGALARLDRDVIARAPTLAIVALGINDSNRDEPATFAANLRALTDRLDAASIPVLLLTTSVLGPSLTEAEPRLVAYNAEVRALAAERGYRLGDVWARMDEVRGQRLHSPDDCHLSSDGYQAMTRAVLDGLGLPEVAVPDRYAYPLFPGTVASWRVRALGESPLDAAGIAAVSASPDDGWRTVALPQTDDLGDWFWNQLRDQGFVSALDRVAGRAPGYVAVSDLDVAAPRDAIVSTGGGVRAVWIDGSRLHDGPLRGLLHAGSDRLPVRLAPGAHRLVVESSAPYFFLAISDQDDL